METTITWKINADTKIKRMVTILNHSESEFEWADAMDKIMDWAFNHIMEESPLARAFEVIYESNWEDANHTKVEIKDNQLVIVSDCPAIHFKIE